MCILPVIGIFVQKTKTISKGNTAVMEELKLPVGPHPDMSSISRALVIVAHPDDIDYGSAGAVATMTEKGIDVSYCLVTSGDAGGDNDGLSRDERISMRESEQSAAAQKVGVERVHFLRQPDGCIEANLELREKLTRVIRKEKPDLIITQSPERRYDRIFASHPDHLAVGEATLSAVYPDSQNPHAFPHLLDEGHAAHTVKAVWIAADKDPDTFVDITDVMKKKFEALFQHVSQIADQERTKEMVNEWCSNMAQLGGLGNDRYAEAYRFVQIAY